jgi:hypothetical protein
MWLLPDDPRLLLASIAHLVVSSTSTLVLVGMSSNQMLVPADARDRRP